MKLEKITVSFSAEKLQAIRILKEDVYKNLEKELADCLEKIYVKSIPQSTRQYIEAKMKEDESSSQRGGNK